MHKNEHKRHKAKTAETCNVLSLFCFKILNSLHQPVDIQNEQSLTFCLCKLPACEFSSTRSCTLLLDNVKFIVCVRVDGTS